MAMERRARLRRSLWWLPDVRAANMTAVSIDPIVTNSVTKLDRRRLKERSSEISNGS
jgi:hypothetical protein